MIGEDLQKFSGRRVMRTIAIRRLPIRNLPNYSLQEKNRVGADVTHIQQGLEQSNYASATRTNHPPLQWVIPYSGLIYLPSALAIWSRCNHPPQR
ncbi:hypothetical protein AVEN_271192-1 [Araneus ventricosus]|uniref:Uncharacterized protein n=1 Tax=Araneus ventricosus TaxID=182803 RepID=A0A4Y2TFA9_ARAVE|nr:hypothetical protein AVEN_271192-1 [Araneus ventricosus]